MDRQDIIRLVTAQCAASIYPTLSDGDIADLVDATVGFSLWKVSTAYVYGDVVQPTVRNGHLYKCVVAGTSDITEPFWPTYTASDDRIALTRPHWHGYYGPMPGSQVGDGPSLVWLEHGPDSGGQYNAQVATYRAWLQKAALATADYGVSLDRSSLERQQVYEHCMAQARNYMPTTVS